MSSLLDFRDPYEMLLFLDDALLAQRDKLYDWQKQFMVDFAREEWSAARPFRGVVRAANGSGKDKYIIAACYTWFLQKFKDSVAIVTSSSAPQLDRQTNTYIKQLADAYNSVIGDTVWKINARHYEFLPNNATGELFVTDESGRAEGWHPKVTGGKLAIFTSESKSIPEEIFIALARCTGFTHRVDVSSPGIQAGHFYNVCQPGMSTNRKDIESPLETDKWIQYHVTAYDCTHLSRSYIEDLKTLMPGGESGAAFKSCVLAEFGDTDGLTVVSYVHIWRACKDVQKMVGWLKDDYNTGGLDLSAGGDETVLSVRNGNRLLKVIPFKFNNTTDTENFLVEKFKEHGLDNPKAQVFADAGGLGKPIIDHLREKGWTNIRYVLNQAKAHDYRVYGNRGTEMWFNFAKFLELGELWLVEDVKLTNQLATRYYRILEGKTHKLESKLQARAAGRPSPDRADSVVLAFSNYKSKLEYDESKITQAYEEKDKSTESDDIPAPFELRTWANEDKLETFLSSRLAKDRLGDLMIRRELARVNQQRKIEVVGDNNE
jgi:hypothetical protein